MSLKWLAAGATSVAAAALLVALGAWYFFLRDSAQPASVADAVAAFRAQQGAGWAAAAIPPGVYLYESDGLERTDALGGATHRYPRTSTISVTTAPCGVRMRWDVLEGRSSTWTLCVGPDGWTEKTWDEQHTFFGIGDATTYTCTDTPFRPADDEPGTTFAVSCKTGSTRVRGHGRVVARVPVEVEGRSIESVRVRTSVVFAGSPRGSATFDFWLARDTGLPVRIRMVSSTTNDTPIGDVHYEEDVSLALTSTTPRR